MTGLLISATVRLDITHILGVGVRGWGAAQGRRYRSLIEKALNDLLRQPEHPESRAREEIYPGKRTFHIARPGRTARHLIPYRIAANGDLHALRLLNDAMDLPGVLPGLP